SGESSCPLEVQVAQDAMSRKGSDQHSFRVHVSGEVAQYASMSRRRAGHAWGEVKRDGIEDYPSTRGTLPRADPRTVVTTVNAGEDAPLGEGVERVKGRRCRGRARDVNRDVPAPLDGLFVFGCKRTNGRRTQSHCGPYG